MIDTVALRLLCWDRVPSQWSLASLHAPQVRELTTYTTVAMKRVYAADTYVSRCVTKAAEPRSTAGHLFPIQYLCGMILLNGVGLAGFKSRPNVFL